MRGRSSILVRTFCAAAVLAGAAATSAAGQEPGVPWTFRWGPQRADLVRFNRVEGLSLGARGQLLPETWLGPLSVTATARVGTGSWTVDRRLEVALESHARRVGVAAYSETATVDEDPRHFGVGNTLNGLLLGRDYGDYYRRTGVSAAWTPPAFAFRSFRGRVWGERHEALATETDFSLAHLMNGNGPRPNLTASEGWDAGWSAEIARREGTDPRAPRVEGTARYRQGVADWHYTILDGLGALSLPMGSDFRVDLEAAGGRAWGKVPPQRRFLVGGVGTVRGHTAAGRVGTVYGRIRGEVGRDVAFGGVGVFSDAGWAGDPGGFRSADVLASVGIALTLADGVIRTAAAWRIRGGSGSRVEVYLDAIP